MERPKAVLFDLCDTLYLFDPAKLPTVTINGLAARSTVGYIHRALSRAIDIPLEAFYEAYTRTSEAIARQCELDHREVTTRERLRAVLEGLNATRGRVPDQVLEDAVEAHMARVAGALHLPPHHLALLRSLQQDYPVGLVTNFDHTDTVYHLLDREGVRSCFRCIVISAEIGWRKPGTTIFEKALQALRLPPSDALFVGNDPWADVAGAHRAGMRTVWFNRHRESIPEGDFPRTPAISDLGELASLL